MGEYNKINNLSITNSPIKIIFFDLFGVLLGSDQSTVINWISSECGLSIQKTYEILMGENFMQLERREISFEHYFHKLQNLLPSKNPVRYSHFLSKWFSRDISELPPVKLLENLQESYQLWIISNTTESHISQLRKKHLFLNNFNGIITSETAESRKPNEYIFEFANEKTHMLPGESIFIDDTRENVNVAKNMGFITHCYKNFETLQQFFKKHLK